MLIQSLEEPEAARRNIRLLLLRDDLAHPRGQKVGAQGEGGEDTAIAPRAEP